MAELTPSEKLQPSLLDRLTDNDPTSKVEPRERRVLSPDKLRDSVRRDLGWLLNTPNMKTVRDLSEYPEVERSTLNFGLPDLAGHSASSVDVNEITRALRRAIIDFEPRLVKSTVQVQVFVDPSQVNPNAMSFSIQAELWSQPLPVRLYLRTDLDLEDGEVRVTEVTPG